ncbi:glycoside hydrolase superfamily [Tribonema minus]|uniref:Glycoside hydrolase superfamily n=1 Tax=Tribonema minus TaxID=303371 RepID=A0A835ZB64_9STRA|nr:glycoside hydrolase superfamily [Tribonema minus]
MSCAAVALPGGALMLSWNALLRAPAERRLLLSGVAVSVLRSIAQGAYDHYLQAFGKAAKKDGRPINVRPLHEMNGAWYPWCVFTTGNSLSDFKNAFKRVVSVLKSTGGNFKFQLSYAAQNASGHKNPFMDFYPGDAYVDAAEVNAFVSGFRMFKSATGGRRLFADIEPAEGEEADFEVAENELLALPAPATAAEEAQQHL